MARTVPAATPPGPSLPYPHSFALPCLKKSNRSITLRLPLTEKPEFSLSFGCGRAKRGRDGSTEFGGVLVREDPDGARRAPYTYTRLLNKDWWWGAPITNMRFVLPILALSACLAVSLFTSAQAWHGVRTGRIYYEPNCPPVDFRTRPIAFVAYFLVVVAILSVFIFGAMRVGLALWRSL